MTRAALLPAGSDPFGLAYWLRNYATWAQYVDELHITISGAIEPEPYAYIEAAVAAAPNATLYNMGQGRTIHGEMLTALLSKTTADHIMFCEDDAFIRRPEIVDECFRFAEEGGIVATPRGGYASHEVVRAAFWQFGDEVSFWPCFVFASRAALEATDRDFGPKTWQPGDDLLGHVIQEVGGADTFVWGSYQLRSQGLEERLLDNHRLSGQNVPDDAPWFHVGSLSGGHGLAFMGGIDDIRYRFEVDGFQRLPAGNAWQRFGWWERMWRAAEGAIPDYRERYHAEMVRFRDDVGISAADVEAYQPVADHLVTWAER